MSHYAKLAALGFRFIAMAGLLYSLPSVVMMARFVREPGMNGGMQLWAIAAMLIFPILAVVLYLVARPLGVFIAKGIE